MNRVLVIGGTEDSRHIIEKLIKHNIKVTATVTTSLGSSLLSYERLDVKEGKLTMEDMVGLINEIKPSFIIDASHPFAREASINAMEAGKTAGIPYIRYERPLTPLDYEKVIKVISFEEALDKLQNFKGNMFITTGSKNLEVFIRVPQYKTRVYVRVLPESSVLQKCESLGFDARNIFAIKGPFTVNMNMEMLRHCKACVMVTKDSGSIGGNEEKISSAKNMGIPVIMIGRPKLDYECEVRSIEEVIRLALVYSKGI